MARMYVPSLVLVAVSVAGVAAGCRTDDPRPVDLTPAYCAELGLLRARVDAQFGQAEVTLPSVESPPAGGAAGAPSPQAEGAAGAPSPPAGGAAGAPLPPAEGAAAAPALPDVIACVKALHTASKAAVTVGQFSRMDNFATDVQRIAGFESSAYRLLDPALAAHEVEIYAPDAWCVAGEIARVKAHIASWRARFLAQIDETAAQCSAGAPAAQ
jgi:hypothetical protein